MTDIHGLKPDVWPNTPYNVTAQIRGDIRQIVQREIEQVTIGTIGAETPAGAQAKVDTSAASLTAAIAAAKAELLAADALLAPLAHTHDDRYYLKAQVDASLAGKAAISHAHDDRYYTESEVDAALAGKAATSHSHNEQYYTEAEIDTALAGKANTSHTHDDRYYTEAQTNDLLATKASTSHIHDDRYFTEAEVTSALAGKAPLVHDHNDRYYTEAEIDTALAGKAALVHDHTASQISNSTATGRALITAVTATAARTAISAAPALGSDDNYVTDAEKLALHSHANKTALDAVSGTNTGDEPAASTTVAGIVKLATATETTTGTDTTRATTPAGVKAALDAKAASDMSTYAAPTGTDARLQVAGVDVTPAQVGAATAAQGAKADAAYAADLPATNIVVNGDFSNGTVGWSPSVYGTITATNNEVTYTVTTPSSASSIEQTTDLAIVGRQYYLRGAIFPKYATTSYLQIGNAGAGSFAPTPSTWNDYSAVVTATTNSRFRFYHGTNTGGYAVGDTIKYRRVLAIDLTATFGAGLEPTKTEMDVLLSRYPSSWFGGTVNDLTRWYDPLNRVGLGSPYNVVTPRQKGETWTDLDQTNGARKWVATGTSVTSWVVTDGDTGWRNITGLLINGWTAGQILLTREGKWCHLQVYVLDGTASTSNIFLDPTAGFSANSNYRGALFSTTMAWQRMITPFTTANKPVAPLYGTLSWVTTAAWPTTLPGTPA